MIVDPFAGPGGWSEGLRMLGLADIGIEWDAVACATRAAAGHATIRADVAQYPPERFAGAEGCIFSPPCPDFSVAGKRAGRNGKSGYLIDIVPVWVDAIRPRWVACEQVPPCLPIWQEHAGRYRQLGYSTWCGVLNAADYGVPQTRQRAFLLASLDRPAVPPEPTHCRGGAATMFGTLAPWVSMADALGWEGEDAPARTLCGDRSPRWLYPDRDGTHGRVLNRRQQVRGVPVRPVPGDEPALTLTGIAGAKGQWVWERPATTLTCDARVAGPHAGSAGESQSENAIRLTIAEALTLQSFTPDYPVQGTKTKQFEQVGNAVPPLLAAHVIAAITGQALEAAA